MENLHGFDGRFDYDVFCYIVDNGMLGSDMRLDEKQKGLIKVSVRKLRWYQEREVFYNKRGMETAEVDPESMFIHEIAEFISSENPEVLFYYLSRGSFLILLQIK